MNRLKIFQILASQSQSRRNSSERLERDDRHKQTTKRTNRRTSEQSPEVAPAERPRFGPRAVWFGFDPTRSDLVRSNNRPAQQVATVGR